MAKYTLNPFLTEFVETVYGSTFQGALPLFNKQTKKTRFFDSASVPALVRVVQDGMSCHDLYLGIATQPSDLDEGKRGGNSSVVQVSAVFADIDFAHDKLGPKRYPHNKEVARRILDELPYVPTLIQSSGGGLHAIWVLKEPIICATAADRKRVAKLMKKFHRNVAEAFQRHGYEIDDCSDLARVFRVPLSLNHKYGQARLVDVLEWNPEARIDLGSGPEVMPSATASKSRAPLERNANHALICQNCPWYNYVTGDGAAAASEPEWLAGGSITAACEDGRAIFDEYSSRHPKYNQRETGQKFDHIELNLKPFTCAVIEESYGGEAFCSSCQWRGQIKSPVQLGSERQLILLQQRLAALDDGWAEVTKAGYPRASFRNAILCLIRLRVEIRYDLFRMRISVNGVAIQEFAGDMNDDALAYLRKLAADEFGFDPGKTNIADAAHTIALENAYHPIRDYLDGLAWDGKERLARILIDYFGAEDTEIIRAFALAVFVAAVRRIRAPGTKFDIMLALLQNSARVRNSPFPERV